MKKLIIYWIIWILWIVSYWVKNWYFTKEQVIDTSSKMIKEWINKVSDIKEEDIKKWVEKTLDITEKLTDTVSEQITTINKTWEWNTSNDSFSKAKKTLLHDIYNNQWKTIYCWCDFKWLNVDLKSCWYQWIHTWMKDRSKKVEFEHVVPAENFWKAFVEWREWNKDCVDSKWKAFKWRKCAEKTNEEYRLMQADMYNLYPSVWEVNALRSNLDHWMIAWKNYQTFWSCWFKYSKEEKKVEPTNETKWLIARTYLYMNASYSKKLLSDQNLKLYEAWDKQFPVTKFECQRYIKIKKIQWNENVILKDRCEQAWFIQ